MLYTPSGSLLAVLRSTWDSKHMNLEEIHFILFNFSLLIHNVKKKKKEEYSTLRPLKALAHPQKKKRHKNNIYNKIILKVSR